MCVMDERQRPLPSHARLLLALLQAQLDLRFANEAEAELIAEVRITDLEKIDFAQIDLDNITT